jgi:acetyltransferase-like isoleucine patch superfamily enzyme
MKEKKQSLTFKLLKRFNLISDEEKFGNISMVTFISFVFKRILVLLLYKYSYSSMLLDSWNFKFIRARIWRYFGCKIGTNVSIGNNVAMDYGFANLIEIGDNVMIANRCLLLCHKRDLSNFKKGDDPTKLAYKVSGIKLENNCQIGMGVVILPGITVGEGAVVGANSLVTKDVEPWTIVAGQPAKLIRRIENKYDE